MGVITGAVIPLGGTITAATAIETIRQHREILTAMLAQNWSAARKALSHHIRHNHPILDEVGKKENAWMANTWKRGDKARIKRRRPAIIL